MKKSLVAGVLGLGAALASTAAWSQNSPFTGFSLGGNVNFVTAATEISAGGTKVNLGETSQSAALQAAYGIPMGQTGVLNFGGTYSLVDIKAGSATNYELKAKDLYTLYVEPGMQVGANTLLYGKLAYASTKGESKSAGVTASKDYNGFGLGAGVRVALDKNWAVQAEFMQLNFDSQTVNTISYKPSATLGTVGVVYKF